MERIKKYIEDLFKDAPQTERNNQIQEEVISELNKKYQKLVKDGLNESTAYKDVTSNITSASDILASLKHSNTAVDCQEAKKRIILVTVISFIVYILCLITALALCRYCASDYIIACILFSVAGIITCFLVHHFLLTPKYHEINNSIISGLKEWQQHRECIKKIKKMIIIILWIVTGVVYFIVSIAFKAFYITWIIPLIAAIIQNIFELIFKTGELENEKE